MFLGVHYSETHYSQKTNCPKQQLVHVQVHTCVYMWQGPKPISEVFFNRSPCYISESLLKPLWDPPSSTSPLLVHTAVPGFLNGCWGSRLGSSCLHSKHFLTESPPSQTPKQNFFLSCGRWVMHQWPVFKNIWSISWT